MQSSFFKLSLVLLSIATISACTTAPEFDIAPEIGFISISKSEMVQNENPTDSLFLKISFKDGDGDLGTDENSTMQNIFLVDNRSNIIAERYKVPPIPAVGKQKGIEGEITLKVFTTCCRFDEFPDFKQCDAPPSIPTNELSYEIYMIDDAGNESNRVQSSTITLFCD